MIAVIGIGSPFGADRLGWQVIDYLQASKMFQSELVTQVSLCKLDRPGSGIIEYLQNVDAAILIDAIKSPRFSNKQVVTVSADELLQNPEHASSSLISSHGFGLAQAIELAQSLNVLPEKTNVVGMNIAEKETEAADENIEHLTQQDIKLLADTVSQLVLSL